MIFILHTFELAFLRLEGYTEVHIFKGNLWAT
jgi:hypothetical protein